MLYTIAEVSNLIGLSKVSIYKKLKLKELQEHIVKKQGITYINDMGFNLIKSGLNLKEEVKTDLKQENTEQPPIKKISASDTDLTLYLKEQIELKDKQINDLIELTKELNDRLADQQELMKNDQILQLNQPRLPQQQQQKEEASQEVAADQQTEKPQKKGLFRSIFKK